MYTIRKISKQISSINDPLWSRAEIAKIETLNWEGFDYIPKTTCKILYNDYGIYIQFETDENPLLARVKEQNGRVCCDSCMEIFISPNKDDKRYFNFEFNHFGTMYFGVRSSRFDGIHPDKNKEYFNVQTYVDEKKWVLQFVIPFELINEIFGGYTKEMHGNLYKCGEDTKKEHYITYYPITCEKPDFHRPECFGQFILE